MLRCRCLVVCLCAVVSIVALATAPQYGTDSVQSEWMRDWYHYNDWMHYLDNYNTFVTVEQETTGEYDHTAQQIFSIAGNSYKWNKYYLNGFRVDSRFFVGSAFYNPDLWTESMQINYYESAVRWTTDSVVANSVQMSGNGGGIGGISPGTKELIHLFHRNATERLYMPVGNQRNKIIGAGSAMLNYNIPSRIGRTYLQQFRAEYGQRKVVSFDETGINAYIPYNYSRVQLAGQLPVSANAAFDRLDYVANYQYREDYGSEFYLNRNELALEQHGGLSVYGTKQTERDYYVLGLTSQTVNIRHHDLCFSRNLIDQDGESFEPWSPDGWNTELTFSAMYERKLLPWLKLHYDGYNSAIYSHPSTLQWSNSVYLKLPKDTLDHEYAASDLYLYEWTSNAFWSGLLENTVGLKADYEIARWIGLKADLDITFDAVLLGKGKSLARPNWQAGVGFDIHPAKWFRMELNMQKKRVAFNYDDVRFFSSDYMNGNIYYLNNGVKGGLFSTTGGQYHIIKKGLRQTSYFVFDIPVYFTFADGNGGKHEVQFMQSYRKYWNCRTLEPWSEAQYGYSADETISVDNHAGGMNIWHTVDGQKLYTVTDSYPRGIFGSNIFTNSPYYLSSVIRYQYSGKKVLFAVAWQSYQMCGVSALGNGAQSNNLNILSESLANPNTWVNYENQNSQHQATGRLDQDRAYECWIQLTYNPLKQLGFTFTGKYRDGQPVTSYTIHPLTDEKGNTHVEVFPTRTRGINMFDGKFGSREDAFFNIDLRAVYRPVISGHNCEFQLVCYNLYDFGSSLHEYAFVNGIKEFRNTLSLCIPRGLIFTAKVEL